MYISLHTYPKLGKSSTSRKGERWLTDGACSQSFVVADISFSFYYSSLTWHFFSCHNKSSSNQFQLCKFCCLLSNFSMIFPFSVFIIADHWGKNNSLCLLTKVKGMLDFGAGSQSFPKRSQDAKRGSLGWGILRVSSIP